MKLWNKNEIVTPTIWKVKTIWENFRTPWSERNPQLHPKYVSYRV